SSPRRLRARSSITARHRRRGTRSRRAASISASNAAIGSGNRSEGLVGQIFEGSFDGSGHRYAIVCARFNAFITERLLEGARDGLVRHGVDWANVDGAWVPGSYEIPLVARRLAQSGRYDAVICLGAVIRGATAHFDYVAGQAATGIAQAAAQADVPV